MQQPTLYTVEDTMNDSRVILAMAPIEDVCMKLKVTSKTIGACINNDHLCQKRYRITASYPAKTQTGMPDDLRQQWLEMQRLFGITPEEDYEAEF